MLKNKPVMLNNKLVMLNDNLKIKEPRFYQNINSWNLTLEYIHGI